MFKPFTTSLLLVSLVLQPPQVSDAQVSDAQVSDVLAARTALQEIEQRSETVRKQRDRLITQINLGNVPEQELRELAAQQKQAFERSRDDYRAVQNATLNILAGRYWAQTLADEKKQNAKKLLERSQSRSKMIEQNNRTIAENRSIIEASKNSLPDLQSHVFHKVQRDAEMSKRPELRRESVLRDAAEFDRRTQTLYRSIGEAESQNARLQARNEAAMRVIQAIDTINRGGGEAGTTLETLGHLQDALTQEKNTWDRTLSDFAREGEWARRVAAELFLGMNQAVLESMNPEMILIESSPELKEKFARTRAEMYQTMADGIDGALELLLKQAGEARASLPEHQAALQETLAEIEALETQALETRARHIVTLLPKGTPDENVLANWLKGSKTIAGYPQTEPLRKAILVEFLKAREQRLQALEAMFAELAEHRPVLEISPSSPIPWDISQAEVRVTAQLTQEPFGTLISNIRDSVRRLTGLAPQVVVTDQWVLGDKQSSSSWPETAQQGFVFDKPGTSKLQVQRQVRVQVNFPPRSTTPAKIRAAVQRQIETRFCEAEIVIQPPPPTRRFAGATRRDGNGELVLSITQTQVVGRFDTGKKSPHTPQFKDTMGEQGVENLMHNTREALSSLLSGFSSVGTWKGDFDPATGTFRGTFIHDSFFKGERSEGQTVGRFAGKLQGNQLLGTYTYDDPEPKNVRTFEFQLNEVAVDSRPADALPPIDPRPAGALPPAAPP